MLDQQHLHEIEARCTQEAPPSCQSACPLRLDVRLFVSHMAEGRWAEARKLLDRHLPLPGILCHVCDHPCEDLCLRRDLGGALAVADLERACLRLSSPPRPLPRPRKEARVAVLGAGLAGLVAAADLARKGLQVTLWYEGHAAAALKRAFPLAAHELLEAEVDALGRELIFCQGLLDGALLEQAAQDFLAIFVDASAAPHLVPHILPERAAVDAATLLWRDNICVGGWQECTATGHQYASASRQAGDGRRAAQSMERVAGGFSLTAARADAETERRLHANADGTLPLPRLVADAQGYTEEEAQAEAARCLRCQCLSCVRACVYLREHQGYPRLYARQMHNNASIVKGLHVANALINGCTLCGQCTEICPERFSMADLCLTVRRDMVQRAFMPPSAHEFALEDMHSAVGEHALFMGSPVSTGQTVDKEDSTKAAWAFFPGCQLWAARGEQVRAVWELLQQLPLQGKQQEREWAEGNAGVGLILSCCGIPAHWAGQEAVFEAHRTDFCARWQRAGSPRLIVGCASCLKILEEFVPETRPVSLWEVLDSLWHLPAVAQGGDQSQGQSQGMTFSVHDPCAARHNTAWLQAVRSLAKKCGAQVHEAPFSGEKTGCCGYGGLVWNARPALADNISAALAQSLPHTGLASCVMCRDRLVMQGKECAHVLDLLPLGVKPLSPQEKMLGLSARRAARLALREILCKSSEKSPLHTKQSTFHLHISPDVLAAMERQFILRQDAEEAVAGVQNTGARFLEQDSGHYVGAWRPRHVTFWVRYSCRGDGSCELHDAWCHRMVVPGAGSTGLEGMLA